MRFWLAVGLMPLVGLSRGVMATLPDLVCYVQWAGDRTQDLSTLCRQPALSPQVRVVVTEIRIVGNRVVGRVRNDTGQTLQRVIVNYEVVGQNNTRYREFGFVEPESLAPGQTGVFRGGLRDPGPLQVTTVDWW